MFLPPFIFAVFCRNIARMLDCTSGENVGMEPESGLECDSAPQQPRSFP